MVVSDSLTSPGVTPLVSGPSLTAAGTAASRSHSVALGSPVTGRVRRSIVQVWAEMLGRKGGLKAQSLNTPPRP